MLLNRQSIGFSQILLIISRILHCDAFFADGAQFPGYVIVWVYVEKL